jgi:hypothetical protein
LAGLGFVLPSVGAALPADGVFLPGDDPVIPGCGFVLPEEQRPSLTHERGLRPTQKITASKAIRLS